jgi:hypothetical protein
LGDQANLPEAAYEEDIDEYGLPIRLYDSPDSETATLIIKMVCIFRISVWFEEYFEVLKDSDCAFEHGIGILELMVRYLSSILYEFDKALRGSEGSKSLDFGNLSYKI